MSAIIRGMIPTRSCVVERREMNCQQPHKFQRGVVAVGGDRMLGKVRFEQRTKRVEGLGGDLNRALLQGVLGVVQKSRKIRDE